MMLQFPLLHLSLTGLLLSTAAVMIIGSVWYSPLLFVKQWLRYVHPTKAPSKAAMLDAMIWGLVNAVAGNVLLGLLLSVAQPLTLLVALMFATLSWLAFVAPLLANCLIYEQRPLGYVLITAGNSFLGMMVSTWALMTF